MLINSSFFPLFEKVIQLLPQLEMLEATSDVLMILLGDSRISGLERSVANHLYPILITMNPKLLESIQEEDEEFILPFCKLICKFAEVFATFLIEGLPGTKPFMDMLLACTAYPALYPSNPDISEIPLYFWFTFESEIETTNELRPSKYNDQVIQMAHEILFQVLSILVNQAKYPLDSVVAGWSKDALDRFKGHRRECGDTALYCYYALEERALFQVVNGITMEMQFLSQDVNSGTQLLETLIFHLKSFAESISSDEDQYIPMIFQQEALQFLVSIAQSKRDGAALLRMTLASTIGNY